MFHMVQKVLSHQLVNLYFVSLVLEVATEMGWTIVQVNLIATLVVGVIQVIQRLQKNWLLE